MDIGFIGLGVMGAPMAGHLARAGHRLTVFDINTYRAREVAGEDRAGGGSAPGPPPGPRSAHGQGASAAGDEPPPFRLVVLHG